MIERKFEIKINFQGKLIWERKITICKLKVRFCLKSWNWKTYQYMKKKEMILYCKINKIQKFGFILTLCHEGCKFLCFDNIVLNPSNYKF